MGTNHSTSGFQKSDEIREEEVLPGLYPFYPEE